jgi:hypothetical protein
MKKREAINHYLNSYRFIDENLINTIWGKTVKSTTIYDKRNQSDLQKLKIFIKNLQ